MKHVQSNLVLVFLSIAAPVAQASIDISVGNVPADGFVSFVTGAVDPSGGNSGFLGTIYDKDMNPIDMWETFCVEAGAYAEFVHLDNRKYDIYSTSTNNAVSTGNLVTDAAKWVYYAFGRGLLTGWDPDKGEEVQEAIWSLVEGGGAGGPNLVTATGDALTWRNQALAAVATADGKAAASRIRIINPIDRDGNPHRQSMLYEVPEPGTFLIWACLGMIGVKAMARRPNVESC